MQNPLKNLIEIIKTGSPEEVKVARKKVEKFWHEVYIPKREEGRKAFSIFLDEIKKFDQIGDINHQAYFIYTLKRPFWSIGEEHFEEWADFILKYIQHPSGKIRQAIVKVANYLIMDIVVDLKVSPSEKLSQESRQRIQKNRERFGSFVSRAEELLERYDEPRFHRYKYISNMPVSIYKSLQKLLVEDLLRSEYYEKLYADFLEQKGDFQIIQDELMVDKIDDKDFLDKGDLLEKKGFQMPKWMECNWRRVPCGRDDCPICGRIKKDRQGYLERGGDPDDLKNVFEDVGRNFKEALGMIKKDAERRGIDITNIENIKEPPEPKEFPFYRKVEQWNKSVMTLGDTAQVLGEFWIYTEEAADLFWYANILMAKAYRQICNRWHIENGDDYGDFDYQYTGYVLKECLAILKKSLRELIKKSIARKEEFGSILSEFLKLEKQIMKFNKI